MSVEGCPDRIEFFEDFVDMSLAELDTCESLVRQCGCPECMQDLEIIQRARAVSIEKHRQLVLYRRSVGIPDDGIIEEDAA